MRGRRDAWFCLSVALGILAAEFAHEYAYGWASIVCALSLACAMRSLRLSAHYGVPE